MTGTAATTAYKRAPATLSASTSKATEVCSIMPITGEARSFERFSKLIINYADYSRCGTRSIESGSGYGTRPIEGQ